MRSLTDTISNQTVTGAEGAELLAALEKFIVATVASYVPPPHNLASAKVNARTRARERYDMSPLDLVLS